MSYWNYEKRAGCEFSVSVLYDNVEIYVFTHLKRLIHSLQRTVT